MCTQPSSLPTIPAPTTHPQPTHPSGDEQLRGGYSRVLQQLLGQLDVTVQDVVDLGCATGLSSLELLRALPEVESIIGIDLSPHFLAVAQYEQQQRMVCDVL